MSAHHPGTWAAHSSDRVDLTDAPWALTTHLLAINNQQMRRATRHPFLERAAKGALPKHLVAQWLSNDRQYIEGYISVTKHTLNLVRSTPDSTIDPDIQRRLITWLETAIKNGERERDLFNEVAEIYKIDVYPAPLQDNVKSEGLRRYEALFNSVMSQQPNSFIPWLEGAVLLWATEKIYYEAWSWARRQDTKGSPRSYDTDMDGGAMRREFIPNWANRVFLMFVEQLERIINEGVSIAVNRDAQRWIEVKSRADPIWRALLDAEEAFWPNISGNEGSLIEPGVQRREDGKMEGTTLRSTGDNEILNDQQGVRASDVPAMRSNEQMVK